jgi:predicted MFS family arabinose efflux permease
MMGALIFSAYPLLLGLARDSRLFWLASFSAGVVWALVNAGLVNRLMERAPDDDRPAHMALHNLVLNTGILAGSVIGPELLGGMDLRQAVLLSALLRFLGGLSFIPWG